MAAAPQFQAEKLTVPAGSRLHLFSDGAFEIALPDGGSGRLTDLTALLAGSGSEQGEPDRLYHAMWQLAGRRPFEDDVSLITLTIP